MKSIDLNCDLGESYGAYKIGNDESVIPLITSANIACGFHASDPSIMGKTVALAAKYGVGIGAHPGYPDLQGFGRRPMKLSPDEVRDLIIYQVGALSGFCRACGVPLHHVKLHGALYNQAAADYEIAQAAVRAVSLISPDLIFLGLPFSEMERAAGDIGLPFAAEFFADRGYNTDGSLVSRTLPGAMIEDEEMALTRTLRAVREGVVTSVQGEDVPVNVHSICVHGDSAHALAFVQKLRAGFAENGISLSTMG